MAPPLLTIAGHLRGVLAAARPRTIRFLSLQLSHQYKPSRNHLSSLSTLSNHGALAHEPAGHGEKDPYRAPKGSALSAASDAQQQNLSGNDHKLSGFHDSSNNNNSISDSDSDSSGHDQDGSTSTTESSSRSTEPGLNKYRKPQFTPEIDQEILRLRKQGQSWATIGSVLGIPHRSCHRRYIAALDPGLHELWPEKKVQHLDDLVRQGKPWSEIAKILGMTSSNCQAKWKTIVRPKDSERNRQFDLLQSKVLLQLVEEHGQDDWKAVLRGFMMQLGGRDMAKVTPEQLRHQYYKLMRRPTQVWSLNEETALIQHVLKHGTGQWDMISQALRHHTPEQCKEKWLSLDMNTKIPKEKAWYKAERGNFWRLWQRYGEDWKSIAGSLPKRTADQCEAFFKKETAGYTKEGPERFQEQTKRLAEQCSQYNSYVWKKEDSERLWVVAEECRARSPSGRIYWKAVAEELKMNLSPSQIKHHHYYLQTVREGGLAGVWTEQEIKTLERAVKEVGRDWVLISKKYLPGRNSKSVCHKFNNTRNKGSYISEEEYDALMNKVDVQEQEFKRAHNINGGNGRNSNGGSLFSPNWNEIARSMPGGLWTADDCRDAYEHSFKSHLKSKWTQEEDDALLTAAKSLGRKNWIGVARHVPGKDTWECRLRWAELQQPVLEKDSSDIEAKSIRRHPTMHTPE
ncbi:hypothetical protein BGX28_009355 [Mortierella sp. GBA30]|nr:hypothetical protein BGX28_009355 [Mortierella sp. GBA30]